MDIPYLLYPQYPLGSASYCMRAMAQISLELAENVVKIQQVIHRIDDRTCT